MIQNRLRGLVFASTMLVLVGCRMELNVSREDSSEEGASEFAPPEFVAASAGPVGWTDSNGDSLSFAISDVGIPGVKFECQSGPEATAASATWEWCDGMSGLTRVAYPSVDVGSPSGTYRIRVRAVLGTERTDVVSAGDHRFYVHTSLNNVSSCPTLGTDAQAVAAADAALGSVSATFGSASVAKSPFVKLVWSTAQTSELLSLRRSFTMTSDRRYVLVRRAFVSRMGQGVPRTCEQRFSLMSQSTESCAVYVAAADGRSVCLKWTGAAYTVAYKSQVSSGGLVGRDASIALEEGSGLAGAITSGKFFSRKTRTSASGTGHVLYLPD